MVADLYESPMAAARTVMGMREGPDREVLAEYLRNGGQNLDPATTAWCAAFVNASLAKAGRQGTGSNMARSFMDWGQAVDQPQRGDIAVFTRGDPSGPYGHVGFFDGYDDAGRIRVLGGNQGNAVSIASYDPSTLLGFRRDGEALAQQAPNLNPEVPQQGLGLDALFTPQMPQRPQREDRRAADQQRRRALFEALPGLG